MTGRFMSVLYMQLYSLSKLMNWKYNQRFLFHNFVKPPKHKDFRPDLKHHKLVRESQPEFYIWVLTNANPEHH